MGLPSVLQTGRSGMNSAKTAISTAGHNISNANTEGYSRQRVMTESKTPYQTGGGKGAIGTGTQIARVERVNDEYIEKHLRNGGRELAAFEEKSTSFKQIEDVFNEMGGEGLNRLMAKFFNEFRQLANDPDNHAVREAVREASKAMISDFKRIRTETNAVKEHLDSRIAGHVSELNSLAREVAGLNAKIHELEITNGPQNDLEDQRDLAIKKLAAFADVSTVKDGKGSINVELRGIGPLVTGAIAQTFESHRSPRDERGKPEGSLDITSSASSSPTITHRIQGGKLGALLEMRDDVVGKVFERLDDLAFSLTTAVNQIHSQGYNRFNQTGLEFFRGLSEKYGAAEKMDLAEAIKKDGNNIATAAMANAPGDNRIAVALSGIQSLRILGDGTSTVDDFYNSIVSDVGVMSARNASALNQQKGITSQLEKMRDQISGVSLDEETANILQFQHSFDASAKVIQVANELMDTVLALGR